MSLGLLLLIAGATLFLDGYMFAVGALSFLWAFIASIKILGLFVLGYGISVMAERLK